jgi:hypothetical protein
MAQLSRVSFIYAAHFVTVRLVCLRDTKCYLKILNFQAENSLLTLIVMLDDGSRLGPVSVSLFWNTGSACHVVTL